MSLLDAGHEIAVRSRLPRRHDAVHRRRLQLRRPHRGRRRAALRRAARRVRRRRAQRVGGDPGPRRRRPRRATAGSSARPRRWPGTSSPRPPSTTRPAWRSCPGSTATSPRSPWSAACTRRAACRTCRRWCGWPTRPGRWRSPDLAAERWNAYLALHGVARRESSYDRARLSLNQATIKYADLADRAAGHPRGGHRGVGLWREPVAEVGLATAAAMVADSGLRVSSLCRGGFFTAGDDPTGAPLSRRTAARSRRPPRSRRPAHPAPRRCWCWSRAGCPTTTATCPARGPGPRDAVARPGRRRRGRRGGPGDRADAPDLRRGPRRDLHARPGPRRRRAVPRRHASASSSTPSTSGGTRSSTSRSPRGRAGGSPATRSATGSPRCRPTPCSPAGMMGDGHIDFAAITRAGRRVRVHRRHRGGDLQPGDLGRRPGRDRGAHGQGLRGPRRPLAAAALNPPASRAHPERPCTPAPIRAHRAPCARAGCGVHQPAGHTPHRPGTPRATGHTRSARAHPRRPTHTAHGVHGPAAVCTSRPSGRGSRRADRARPSAGCAARRPAC